MKKKGNIIAYAVLILVFLSFLFPFCLNEIFIYKYNKPTYPFKILYSKIF